MSRKLLRYLEKVTAPKLYIRHSFAFAKGVNENLPPKVSLPSLYDQFSIYISLCADTLKEPFLSGR